VPIVVSTFFSVRTSLCRLSTIEVRVVKTYSHSSIGSALMEREGRRDAFSVFALPLDRRVPIAVISFLRCAYCPQSAKRLVRVT
jgi:hypothetical protein